MGSSGLGLAAFAALVALSLGGVCESPKASFSTFSTTDAFFHSSTTFIVEAVVECGNGAKGMPLYAALGDGRLLAAAVSEETGRYQVSWSEEHEKAGKGTYELAFYDEDGYSALRKASREGGEASAKPLFTHSLHHPGPSRSAYVTSETMCTLAAAAVFYKAYSWRSALTV